MHQLLGKEIGRANEEKWQRCETVSPHTGETKSKREEIDRKRPQSNAVAKQHTQSITIAMSIHCSLANPAPCCAAVLTSARAGDGRRGAKLRRSAGEEAIGHGKASHCSAWLRWDVSIAHCFSTHTFIISFLRRTVQMNGLLVWQIIEGKLKVADSELDASSNDG